MSDDRIDIPAQLGEIVARVIEKQNDDKPVHIILIAFPVLEDGSAGQPAFLTSLMPQEMEDYVTQIAGQFAMAGKRIIDGVMEQ